jgi:hypothetical protein
VFIDFFNHKKDRTIAAFCQLMLFLFSSSLLMNLLEEPLNFPLIGEEFPRMRTNLT